MPLGILIFLLYGCERGPSQSSDSDTYVNEDGLVLQRWMVLDSSRMMRNDSLYKTYQMMAADGSASQHHINPGYWDPDDLVRYELADGKFLKIFMKYENDIRLVNKDFVYNQGDLSWVRYRIWEKQYGLEHGREVYFFLNSDTLYYACERRIQLLGGIRPNRIPFFPMVPSTRPRDELRIELDVTYLPLMEIIGEDLEKREL